MKTILSLLAGLLLCQGASAQYISYFNKGFLSQGNAELDRIYLGIYTTNLTLIAGNTNIVIVTNIPGNSYTLFGSAGGGGTIPGNVLTQNNSFSAVFSNAVTVQSLTNIAGLGNSIAYFDAHSALFGLIGGGGTTVLHGSIPPTYGQVSEDDQILANVATWNVTATHHGYVPLAPNDAMQFLGGLGAWETLGTAAFSNSTAFYLNSNPSNYLSSGSLGALNVVTQGNAFAVTVSNNWTVDPAHGLTATLITNLGATVSTLANYDANKQLGSLANGGANTLVHGTTPPAYSAVVEADQSLSDVTTWDMTTLRHGYSPRGSGVAGQFLQSDGTWGTPSGTNIAGLGTAAYSNASAFYLNSNPSNYITSTAKMIFGGLYGGSHTPRGLTNNNVLTAVFTNTINGGDIGANGTMRISMLVRARDVNGATFAMVFGGTTIWSVGPGFNATQPEIANFQLSFYNRGVQNQQTAINSAGTASFGTYNQDQTVFTIDTSTNNDLVFKIKNGSASSTTNSFEAIDIEVLGKN